MRARTTPDRRLAELAARQHGVVARAQLVAIGFDRGRIDRGVRAGRLHRVHRGVYAVGHPVLSLRGAWLAAVLACGPSAVLSHRSAAALWGLRPADNACVDVTVSHQSGVRSTRRIRLHRTRNPPQTTTHERIPITTPMQTLNDLATVLPRPALKRAAEAAEALRLLDAAQLSEPLTLGNPVRSPLEAQFLALCHDHGIPRPCVNTVIEGLEVDFAWPEHRLIVEVDGHRHHGTRAAFERDRARDARLTVRGWRVIRLTHRRMREADEVASLLLALTGRSPSPSTPG